MGMKGGCLKTSLKEFWVLCHKVEEAMCSVTKAPVG